MLLGLSKLGCAGEIVLGKAGAVLTHDVLPFFSSGTAAPPVWLGKWASPPQSLIQQPITHLHMKHLKSNQLQKCPCFQTHPARSLPCTWCLLGSGAALLYSLPRPSQAPAGTA